MGGVRRRKDRDRRATVHRHDLLVDDCRYGHAIESVRESLAETNVVTAFAFIIETALSRSTRVTSEVVQSTRHKHKLLGLRVGTTTECVATAIHWMNAHAQGLQQ